MPILNVLFFIDSDIGWEPKDFIKLVLSDKDMIGGAYRKKTDNEELYAIEDVQYGTTTITSGTPFSTTISSNSSSIGSAASIGEGVYFIRGTFVDVYDQILILDPFSTKASYFLLLINLFVFKFINGSINELNVGPVGVGLAIPTGVATLRLVIGRRLARRFILGF